MEELQIQTKPSGSTVSEGSFPRWFFRGYTNKLQFVTFLERGTDAYEIVFSWSWDEGLLPYKTYYIWENLWVFPECHASEKEIIDFDKRINEIKTMYLDCKEKFLEWNLDDNIERDIQALIEACNNFIDDFLPYAGNVNDRVVSALST